MIFTNKCRTEDWSFCCRCAVFHFFSWSGCRAYLCRALKDVTDVILSVLPRCSHVFLSLCMSPTLSMCLCVQEHLCACMACACACACLCECVSSLWSTALAQKGRPGRPVLCFASCRKLAANCGSMRRCCFVWSDKVQTKPSGLPCCSLACECRSVCWWFRVVVLMVGGCRIHSHTFGMSP